MQSVNDLCCTGEYAFGNLDAKRGGRFRVDHEFKLIGLLDRNLAGLAPFKMRVPISAARLATFPTSGP